MNRSEFVKARVMPEEKRALLQIAKADRRRPSEALRELIRQDAQRRGLWPPATRAAETR